ncbi:Uncharacterised protein (plasmid) [Tsukamurella tyrosinosolvens]|uniref:Uncharacterized protein n=1 Tax=Tsukamurella tyrosinosolvens TaxID=57704 RepID=A0A1H4UIJ0_TSUTY|nr:hypothetical protein [Tsukamurella tyrosinosolvens]KXO92915.1 hypothetical protein AXK58_13660 [Tsukamurella tyrosinosolvens]SEC68228.1 hypothetical protein SAMN04489793_2906 [Tsukamurella tyrosinosolvens]VEH94233.1 Uncharacterised protein [Tsukamurella tyrosinosolvens]
MFIRTWWARPVSSGRARFTQTLLAITDLDDEGHLVGTFDTVIVGGLGYQTKALGAGMRHLVPGDRVRVAYKSQSEEEYDLSYTHPYLELPRAYTVLAIEELDGEEVAVEIVDGVLTGIVDAPLPAHFDRQGRSIGESRYVPNIAANPEWQRRREEASKAVQDVLRRRRQPVSEGDNDE